MGDALAASTPLFAGVPLPRWRMRLYQRTGLARAEISDADRQVIAWGDLCRRFRKRIIRFMLTLARYHACQQMCNRSVPGIDDYELMPRKAKIVDKLAILPGVHLAHLHTAS